MEQRKSCCTLSLLDSLYTDHEWFGIIEGVKVFFFYLNKEYYKAGDKMPHMAGYLSEFLLGKDHHRLTKLQCTVNIASKQYHVLLWMSLFFSTLQGMS